MTEYATKQADYFAHVRMDMVKLMPKIENARVLEIGAGKGNTLLYLKKNGIAAHVTGIELMPIEDSHQKNPEIDAFYIANIEQDMPILAANSFDIILIGDVLEHLVDPWQAVRKLAQLLKPGGYMLVSIPNLREIKTVLSIVINGDFRYQAEGIMDKTHLRFFCRKNARELVFQAPLQEVWTRDSIDVVPEATGMRAFINSLTLNLFREFWPAQHYLLAQKK